MRKLPVTATLLMAYATSGVAQELPVLSGPFGNIVVPEVVTAPDPVALEATQRKPRRFTPSYVYADGTKGTGLTFGYTSLLREGLAGALTFDGRYMNINPETSPTLDEGRVRAIYAFPQRAGSVVGNALFFEYKNLEDTYDQIAATYSGTFAMTSSIRITANVGWAERDFDAGSTIDDATAGLGLAADLGTALVLGIDYQWENDIARDDNWSVNLSFKPAFQGSLTDSAITVGVAKNDTYMFLWSTPF